MSYSYTLLKWPEVPGTSVGMDVVEEEREFQTLAELQKAVETDIGFVPGWLADCPPTEYIGVEDEQGDFILDIEGAEVE